MLEALDNVGVDHAGGGKNTSKSLAPVVKKVLDTNVASSVSFGPRRRIKVGSLIYFRERIPTIVQKRNGDWA